MELIKILISTILISISINKIDCDVEQAGTEEMVGLIEDPILNDHGKISSSVEPYFKFDDTTLYKINWILFNETSKNSTNQGEELIFTMENQDQYHCILPVDVKIDEKDGQHSKNDDLNPYQLLTPLFQKKVCTYRIENYWTYEICHGKYIRQYHEDVKGSVQEYYLGNFDLEDYSKYEKLYDEKMKNEKLPLINVEDVQLPYIELNMTDGTLCDLSGKKRFTRVLYVCIEDNKHELYSIKETTTCEYEVIAFSSLLCLSSRFKLKTSMENLINCYSAKKDQRTIPEGFELNTIEQEQKTASKSKIKRLSTGSGDVLVESKSFIIDTFANGQEVQINFVSEIDPYSNPTDFSYPSSFFWNTHVKDKFLRGEYCLTGGSAWWKYEFCYGKSVNQYHEEKGKEKVVINLGKWNIEDHMKWMKQNPSKRPKENKTPKHVWHYYSSGDFCDLTQKPRTVEVKLKCRYTKNHDSVVIYLMEPKTCEYILGVESPIICDLISSVDENGIFKQSSIIASNNEKGFINDDSVETD